MSGAPPRTRPRAVQPVPAQPYPPASDYTAHHIPIDTEPVDEEAPFELGADEVPTMRDLSVQIGAVDRRVSNVQRDVARLRTYVMGDHAPRITAVEKRLPPLPPWVKKGGAYGAVAAAWPLLEWLVPLAQKWIESR